MTNLRKTPTNALNMLTPIYLLCYTPKWFSPQGASSGSTDTFWLQFQQNTCPYLNIRLKSSVVRVSSCCHLLVFPMKKCGEIGGCILLRNMSLAVRLTGSLFRQYQTYEL